MSRIVNTIHRNVLLWISNTRLLANQASVEFVCVMMFHIIGSISPTPVANGIALIVLVYFSAKISGAHLNPAISLTFMILGHINPFEMIIYMMSQFFGAIIGALWIAALVPGLNISHTQDINSNSLRYSGCFTPLDTLSDAQVFAWEAVFTCCFITPIFSVVWYTQHKKGYGNTGPIIVGLSLFACALACGQFTGAALNPARALASYVVFQCPYKKIYYYILGEFIGAIGSVVLIIPWYGISGTSWYLSKLSEELITNLTACNRRSIELRTIENLTNRTTVNHNPETPDSREIISNTNISNPTSGTILQVEHSHISFGDIARSPQDRTERLMPEFSRTTTGS